MATISNVRFIRNNSAGELINLVILDLAGNKPSIVRNANAFLQDLDNSFLVDGATSIRSPQVRAIMRDLAGATVTGDIKHFKAGDTWLVTKDSSVITDPSHPEYGNVEVGDKQQYQKDGTRVEGFLTIRPTEQVMARKENAFAIADMMATMNGAFGIEEAITPVIEVTTSVEEAFDPAAVPASTMNEAT